MPIIKPEDWQKWIDNNSDPYGRCCVLVAEEVMRMLDEPEHAKPPITDDTPYKLIDAADDNIRAGGITGFMAGCVAEMVSHCHSRGEEFRRAWNAYYGIKSDRWGIVNPAILTTGHQ